MLLASVAEHQESWQNLHRVTPWLWHIASLITIAQPFATDFDPRNGLLLLLSGACSILSGCSFTVNPMRRIRQHNGELGAGAWKTKGQVASPYCLCTPLLVDSLS